MQPVNVYKNNLALMGVSAQDTWKIADTVASGLFKDLWDAKRKK